MSDSLQIRVAQLEDAVALAALNRAFNEHPTTPDQIMAYLSSGWHTELVLVAEIAGRVVGFACVQFFSSVCYAQPWAELTEVYVAAASRRRGIGRALVHEAERQAQQYGATDMLVRTGAMNGAGQALYQALGYTMQAHVSLQKRLGEPPCALNAPLFIESQHASPSLCRDHQESHDLDGPPSP